MVYSRGTPCTYYAYVHYMDGLDNSVNYNLHFTKPAYAMYACICTCVKSVIVFLNLYIGLGMCLCSK